MPKRSSKANLDVNQIAANIVARVTGKDSVPQSVSKKPEKNPAAVALGRLGGLKGGKARAKRLSASKRMAIAKLAASVRWANKKTG